MTLKGNKCTKHTC